jgi:hypothetical protein
MCCPASASVSYLASNWVSCLSSASVSYLASKWISRPASNWVSVIPAQAGIQHGASAPSYSLYLNPTDAEMTRIE